MLAFAAGEVDMPFTELAALLARARAVGTGDIGVAYLATALSSPSSSSASADPVGRRVTTRCCV
jgi:hypothetical protein